MEKDYAYMVERCSLNCLESMLGDIGIRNINTGIRLFDKFEQADADRVCRIVSLDTIKEVVPEFPGYPLDKEGDGDYKYGDESFRSEHEKLKISSGCYFERAYNYSKEYLDKFYMRSVNKVIKIEYIEL